MKLLFCCGKTEPFLKKFYFDGENGEGYAYDLSFCENEGYDDEQNLNGKVIGECDFEVEKIEHYIHHEPEVDIGLGILPSFECDAYCTKTLDHFKLLEKSCLDEFQFNGYLQERNGYAIHFKNLHILDEPKELKECYKKFGGINYSPICYMPITTTPKNMMKVWLYEDGKWVMYILITIKPEQLYKIIDGEKTIEPRIKVLKEMR